MAEAKKITINDVALAAGVSVSTVSLVLSGKGRISPQRVSASTRRLNSWDLSVIAGHRPAGWAKWGDWPDRPRPHVAVLCRAHRRPDGSAGSPGRMVFAGRGREADQLLQRLDMLLTQGLTG